MRIIFVLLGLVVGALGNMEYFKEGETGSLDCSSDRGEVQYWFLHGKGNAIRNEIDGGEFSPQDVHMNDNGTLQFNNISKADHEGSHVCVVRFQETLEAYSVQMEVRPLPSSNLWESQYSGMFWTGFIAAFVCLLLFAGFCLVQKYRWRPPLTKIENPKLMNSAYVNPTMTPEELEEQSVRM